MAETGAGGVITEVLFYHLERQPLEHVLPSLVAKTLERGWRAVIQVGNVERIDSLDLLLWSYRDDSFLPHGTARDGHVELQPVFLTEREDNPNGAEVRFLVDGADTTKLDGYVRIVYLFDGGDGEALDRARQAWKRAKAQGAAVTYWQQTEQGRWERKA